MTRPRCVRGDDIRIALAQEAARIMFEHGIDDYGFAKRKAAERLGAGEYAALPKNAEIDAAMAEYQRLFAAETHEDTLGLQRLAALNAMERLSDYGPRLVGPVLTGTATPHQAVWLHLFCDYAESVSMRFIDERMNYQVGEERIRMNADRYILVPTIEFEMDGIPVVGFLFPSDGIRQAPLSPTDGKPMRRAGLNEVRTLVQSTQAVSASG